LLQALSIRDDNIGKTIKCVIQNLSSVSRERLSTEHEQYRMLEAMKETDSSNTEHGQPIYRSV